VLYSSDIQRAHETATILSQHLGLPVQPCPGLREWNIGHWIDRMAEDFYAHLIAIGAHPATHVPEGGESHVQTQARMVAQMQAWADQHAEATILGVSHGMAIDLFVRHILGLDVRQSHRIASQMPPSTFFAIRISSGKLSHSTISGISSPWHR
jgi:broad specificity phosphatase PhoE